MAATSALVLVSLSACAHTPAKNPDPNHTHADFAVWIDGKRLDFSDAKYMAEELTPAEEKALKHETGSLANADRVTLQKYLHLHDGNGHVIHRRKPHLTLLDFLHSIGVKTRLTKGKDLCIRFPRLPTETCEKPWVYFTMYVNDPRQGFASALKDDYDFRDGDHILITYGIPENQTNFVELVHAEWLKMTDDACLYSQTCPERRKPPVENCIADPKVPCVE